MSETNYWTRLRHHRMSRRRLLRASAVAGVGAAGLALVGCGDDDDEEGAVAATTPAPAAEEEPAGEVMEEEAVAPAPFPGARLASQVQTGGAIRAYGNPAARLDPHFDSIPMHTWAHAGDPFLEEIDLEHTLRGYLIPTHEIVDDTTTVLNLRENVPFFDLPPANGRTMEARDVVYSFQGLAGQIFPDERHPRAGAFFRAETFTAVDPLTVRVSFSGPSSLFIQAALGDQRNVVIPEGIRDLFPEGGLHEARTERHVGTGPWIPVQYEPFSRFERNPNYWNGPYPYAEAYEDHAISDRATQLAGLLSGEFHIMTRVTQEEIDLLTGDQVTITKHPPESGFFHIGLNNRLPGLSDPRVRQALQIMIDNPGLSAAIVGNDEDWRIEGPLPWTYAEAIPQDELLSRRFFRTPTDADVAEAQRLMDGAGFGDGGLEVDMHTPDIRGIVGFPAVAEHLVAQVDKFLPGNNINILLGTYTDMLAATQAGDFGAYLGGWTHEADAVLMMMQTYQTDGPRATTGYSSARMDALIEDGLAEIRDPDRRASIVRDIQEVAIEDMPVLLDHHYIQVEAQSNLLQDYVFRSTIVNRAWYKYAWLSA